MFGTVLPHAAFKCIDRMEKFTKLSSTKLISLLIRQTLIPPNFHFYSNLFISVMTGKEVSFIARLLAISF